MPNDKRTRTVRLLVENKEISYFWQIYQNIPKSTVGKELGIHFERMQNMIRNVTGIRVNDIFLLSRYFNLDSDVMWRLIKTQHVTRSKPPLKENNRRKISGNGKRGRTRKARHQKT